MNYCEWPSTVELNELTKALFALHKILFGSQKNLSSECEAISIANDFLHPVKFFKCFETSKILSTSFGGCKSFVRRENLLFLDINLSLDHQILQHNYGLQSERHHMASCHFD